MSQCLWTLPYGSDWYHLTPGQLRVKAHTSPKTRESILSPVHTGDKVDFVADTVDFVASVYRALSSL